MQNIHMAETLKKLFLFFNQVELDVDRVPD